MLPSLSVQEKYGVSHRVVLTVGSPGKASLISRRLSPREERAWCVSLRYTGIDVRQQVELCHDRTNGAVLL